MLVYIYFTILVYISLVLEHTIIVCPYTKKIASCSVNNRRTDKLNSLFMDKRFVISLSIFNRLFHPPYMYLL